MKKISAGRLQKAVVKQAQATNIAPARAIKWVGATALFQLLNIATDDGQIDGYCVKGGFAVELRLQAFARTSEDIDLVIYGASSPLELLGAVVSSPWSDFEFRIKKVEERPHCVRVEVQARFNSNDWSTLKIDLLDEPRYVAEEVEAPDLLRFGLPAARSVICLSRAEQIAQWIHSITKPAAGGKQPDRARNIVDLYLFDTYAPSEDSKVLEACIALFERESTHDWPPPIDFPGSWLETLDEWVAELELSMTSAELLEHPRRFMARLLGVTVDMTYDYRFYVLTYRPQRKELTSSIDVPRADDTFVANVALAAFEAAIAEGFRIVQLLTYERVGGVIAVLERPAQDAEH